MKITGQKLSWMIDKNIYGAIRLATLFLDVKDWKSDSGLMNYVHSVNIIWNDEDITDLTIFKTDSQIIDITVNRNKNIFCIIVKINHEIILLEKREMIEKDITNTSQIDGEIYS